LTLAAFEFLECHLPAGPMMGPEADVALVDAAGLSAFVLLVAKVNAARRRRSWLAPLHAARLCKS
jgi:hypothetical protein